MLTETKCSILRNRNYVYLDGKWRHKGDDPDLSGFVVNLLNDSEFDERLSRYTAAINRNVHQVHLGEKLFTFGESL